MERNARLPCRTRSGQQPKRPQFPLRLLHRSCRHGRIASDKEWAEAWGPMVDLLVSDVASTDRNDSSTPYLRSFSPFGSPLGKRLRHTRTRQRPGILIRSHDDPLSHDFLWAAATAPTPLLDAAVWMVCHGNVGRRRILVRRQPPRLPRRLPFRTCKPRVHQRLRRRKISGVEASRFLRNRIVPRATVINLSRP